LTKLTVDVGARRAGEIYCRNRKGEGRRGGEEKGSKGGCSQAVLDPAASSVDESVSTSNVNLYCT